MKLMLNKVTKVYLVLVSIMILVVICMSTFVNGFLLLFQKRLFLEKKIIGAVQEIETENYRTCLIADAK